MFLIVILGLVAAANAFPIRNDPFTPLGPWARMTPPCGVPTFINKLPEEVQEKIREIWANYKEGNECDREHQETREVIHSLSEEIRHQLFAGRCGPSFLRNVSMTIRNEFRNVWFDHRLSLSQKELALKKLAYSLLTGESLALFNKWEEELQVRKAEYAKKVEALSPAGKEALDKWKELRNQEKEFLAGLSKKIREELKVLCGRPGWHTKTNERPEEVVAPTEVMITTTEEPITDAEENSSPAMPQAYSIVKSDAEFKADKEFAHFLDVTLPEVFTEEAECLAFY